MSKQSFLQTIKKKVTTAYIAKIAILSALAFVLYMYCKFKLPFMFPAFLEMQFSELPAILAGFSLGPVAGSLVIIIKCLIKFPFTSTAFVGEIMDMIIGLFYVLPASLVYMKKKTKKSALIGLAVGTAVSVVAAMLFNRVVAIPFYSKVRGFEGIVGMCSALYPNITTENFYNYYIFLAVLPFNLLRMLVVSLVTFFVYKRLSKILHWEFPSKDNKKQHGIITEKQFEEQQIKVKSENATIEKTNDESEATSKTEETNNDE